VIKVECISKKYDLNKFRKEGSDTLYSSAINGIRSMGSLMSNKHTEEFWALKDVSFEIERGDRVGIIGRNGAGKSTLLKILSRITPPTAGRIEYSGRLASLLEVGTGFHGDLSGRENIYLNGSILGMNRREIDKKFDEIVAFIEIEKFIDTPVKRYSSGMYVRKAFAVAPHLEPDILIVDEVLAVGDAAFQKKCLGKMEDVSQNQGRTILFVSHQMAAVQNLCTKGMYLRNGGLIEYGPINQVIPTYLRSGAQSNVNTFDHRKDRSGTGRVRFDSFRLLNDQGFQVDHFQSGSDAIIEISVHSSESIPNYIFSLGLDDDFGTRITHLSNETINRVISVLPEGTSKLYFQIHRLPLRNGVYSFTLFCSSGSEILDWLQDAGKIDIESGDFYLTGKITPEGQGKLFLDYSATIS
jgi:lipopolysaccharide transport system ATP-binding protein